MGSADGLGNNGIAAQLFAPQPESVPLGPDGAHNLSDDLLHSLGGLSMGLGMDFVDDDFLRGLNEGDSGLCANRHNAARSGD